MSSTVQLRKPRNSSSGTSSSGHIGRPKSWTEFNTRFQAFSAPINIDLTPVPKMEVEAVKRREPNIYRKVRPLSTSLLDETSGGLVTQNRPPSPKYTSFMVPNPWRNTAPKSGSLERLKTQKSTNQSEDLKYNYDTTTDNYDEIKNVTNTKITDYGLPQAKTEAGDTAKTDKDGHFVAKIWNSEDASDSDSVDSAVVVSGGSTPHRTSSEKSPRWRNTSDNRESRSSGDFDSTPPEAKSTVERPRTLDTKTCGGRQQKPDFKDDKFIRSQEVNPEVSGGNSPPRVFVSGTKKVVDMEFFPDDDVIRFTESPSGNHVRRTIVPSPLKSCYSSSAAYDALVEISADSDNSSGDENSEKSRSNISTNKGYEGDRSTAEEYQPKPKPTALPRKASLRAAKSDQKDPADDVDNGDVKKERHDARSGTWPRRKAKKSHSVKTIDVEQLMTQFKNARETHITKLRSIYEDSRKRINDVMENLKTAMTENGYREWYPRMREP